MDKSILTEQVRAYKGRPKESVVCRFWANVAIGPPDECWNWTGHLRDGYGRIRAIGKLHGVHRISWVIHNGEIPHHDSAHGMCVLHKCDNRKCVNPAHLFLGTNADNMRDMANKGRWKGHFGEANPHSKLTNIQVRVIKSRHPLVLQAEIAKAFGVSNHAIYCVDNGITWKHI